MTRDATRIATTRARYVAFCNGKGGILNNPALHEFDRCDGTRDRS